MFSKRALVFKHNCIRQSSSRNFSKFFSNKLFKRITQPCKFAFFGSVAVVGLSAYIIYEKRINCYVDENTVTDNIEYIISETNCIIGKKYKYEEAIKKSRDILLRKKDEIGAPGMSIGVSIDGKIVWTEGLGYSDIENRVLCSADTVMRIASISKSITMAAVGKLIEQGKLNLDKPIQEYVPEFPHKTFEGKPVVLTCRHLVSHMAGIRHYGKNPIQTDNKNFKNNEEKAKKEEKAEFDHNEYYIKEKYDVKSSLDLFKDDPLIAKPGSKFYYSTHGYTLISAVIEAISKEEFPCHMRKLFKMLGMKNTYLDENDNIIYHRSRNYKKNKNGHLMNAPYVDNSYKWAGGGFLSNVTDLLQFANAMLYSYQFSDKLLDKHYHKDDKLNDLNKNKQNILNEKLQPGFLNSKTMEMMWSPVVYYRDNSKYAMGWVTSPEKQDCQFCEKVKFCVYHTGGAIGASSILLILPNTLSTNNSSNVESELPPKGVAVVILTNLMSVNLTNTALKIAEIFDNQEII